MYADTDGGTDRHDGINGRFAQLFTNAPKSKYVVKLHFKDTEVLAHGRKAWSYNTMSLVLYQILLEYRTLFSTVLVT